MPAPVQPHHPAPEHRVPPAWAESDISFSLVDRWPAMSGISHIAVHAIAGRSIAHRTSGCDECASIQPTLFDVRNSVFWIQQGAVLTIRQDSTVETSRQEAHFLRKVQREGSQFASRNMPSLVSNSNRKALPLPYHFQNQCIIVRLPPLSSSKPLLIFASLCQVFWTIGERHRSFGGAKYHESKECRICQAPSKRGVNLTWPSHWSAKLYIIINYVLNQDEALSRCASN